MPTAFLTGGTGFVGGHVARQLVAQGWKVRLLVRKPGRTGLLANLPVETIAGDLSEGGIPESALAGVDAILHVAGVTRARTLEDYREVNVRGTERLLAAGGRAAPEALFLIVSSLAAAGAAVAGRPLTHDDPSRPISRYGISKREGEQAVARIWKGPWIAVRPGVIYGPWDRGSGLFEYFRMASTGWMPVPARHANVQILGIDQVSLAIARAAGRRDLGGATRFLSDPQPVRLEELAGLIAGLPRRPARLVGVPSAAVRLLGLFETAVETVSGRCRPFNADKAREILAGDWLCDSSPLRRELALPSPVPLAQGLRATWDWYLDAGWLRDRAL